MSPFCLELNVSVLPCCCVDWIPAVTIQLKSKIKCQQNVERNSYFYYYHYTQTVTTFDYVFVNTWKLFLLLRCFLRFPFVVVMEKSSHCCAVKSISCNGMTAWSFFSTSEDYEKGVIGWIGGIGESMDLRN